MTPIFNPIKQPPPRRRKRRLSKYTYNTFICVAWFVFCYWAASVILTEVGL